MHNSIARNIVYPMADLILGTSILQKLKMLEKTQWWPIGKLNELQNTRLQSLIKYAYENTKYYRRIFRERGLHYHDIKVVADLQKLPILTKNDIRQNFEDLLAKNNKVGKSILSATSGSTGEPLRYYTNKDAISISWASTFRAWEWGGWVIGDKRATLGGSSLIPHKEISLKNRLRAYLERNLLLPAISMDEAKMDVYTDKLSWYEPKILRGYPSAIYLLAKHIKKRNIDGVDVKAIFTTAEMLLPRHRELIEQVFHCKVFDNYGCRDGGGNANECAEHKGLHISLEQCVMEFVHSGNPVKTGESGEIILTDLHNYAMPFIRYQVGDVGVPASENCECGRSLPLIEKIEGRTTDTIAFANGRTLSGPALTLIFKDCNIATYQVIQKSGLKLLIKIVKDKSYTVKDTEYLRQTLSGHLGPEIDVFIEFVDQLLVTNSGKHRFIISEISI